MTSVIVSTADDDINNGLNGVSSPSAGSAFSPLAFANSTSKLLANGHSTSKLQSPRGSDRSINAEKVSALNETAHKGEDLEVMVAYSKGWFLPSAELKLAGKKFKAPDGNERNSIKVSGEQQVREVYSLLRVGDTPRLRLEDLEAACSAMAEDQEWADLQREELCSWLDINEKQSIGWEQFLERVVERTWERRLLLPERIYLAFDEPSSSWFAYFFSTLILFLIVVSSVAYVCMSVPALRVVPEDCPLCEPIEPSWYFKLEAVCITFFTIEYVFRFVCVPLVRPMVLSGFSMSSGLRLLSFSPPERNPYQGHWAVMKVLIWVKSIMNLIDLAAILPFYIDLLTADSQVQLAWLRILRLARIFRIFKLGKYNHSMQMFVRVLSKSAPALGILMFFLTIEVVVVGSVMFYAEGGVWTPPSMEYPNGVYLRPNLAGDLEPSPFTSIPASFWWVIVTATTVGYGDVYPTTPAGKVVGIFTMLSGILVLALPLSIVGNHFSNEYEEIEKRRKARLAQKKHQHKQRMRKRKAVVAAAAAIRKRGSLQPPASENDTTPFSPVSQGDLQSPIDAPSQFQDSQYQAPKVLAAAAAFKRAPRQPPPPGNDTTPFPPVSQGDLQSPIDAPSQFQDSKYEVPKVPHIAHEVKRDGVQAAATSARTRTVLLTGFAAYGKNPINPAELVAKALHGQQIEGHTVVSLIVPHNFWECIKVVMQKVTQLQPAVVLMLGEFPGRAALTVERLAQNLNDATRYQLSDNNQLSPKDVFTVPGGPAAYYTTLPVRAMVKHMRAAGVPADVSDATGTFCCNHLMYGVLHHLAQIGPAHEGNLPRSSLVGDDLDSPDDSSPKPPGRAISSDLALTQVSNDNDNNNNNDSRVRAGWIHLPTLPEMAALRPDQLIPSMSTETSAKGVRAAIMAILTHPLGDISEPSLSRLQV